jgi:FtsP/CotA-like multicopper oxidase with cupredoxin domain
MMAVGGDDQGGHSMAPISAEGVPAATERQGGQPLAFREEAGVKVFELAMKAVRWPIMDGVTVTAWTYNGTVPGPLLRVTEGEQVRVIVKNELPEASTIHWHGIEVPNGMDGVPDMTQPAIQPGETFTYEFTAKPAGTFMYHSHYESDVQVSLGLYAPFIIDPKEPAGPQAEVDVTLMLSEWRTSNGQTFAAMPMAGMEPNYFTINGKAFPATETIKAKVGQRIRLRLAGIGQFVHPMHLHGVPFKIVATDGHPVPEAAQLTKDTVSVAPGERYDIEFIATEPGEWMFHCHIPHHTTNNGEEPGGLMLVVDVVE